ncbi:hypothetical protein GDO78_008515 [Eleutherodactylus coqui]|uniref:Uncharacterized protein n=1 Tax=Eleutherodactylus coqui TaxID=57060 RepID=A0A8J6FD59_ELECQ|nr:hypothetical protein GDO78_008515 [Eleutherodactylus coqui]
MLIKLILRMERMLCSTVPVTGHFLRLREIPPPLSNYVMVLQRGTHDGRRFVSNYGNTCLNVLFCVDHVTLEKGTCGANTRGRSENKRYKPNFGFNGYTILKVPSSPDEHEVDWFSQLFGGRLC